MPRQDVTNELNDIIVDLPNSTQCNGNTISSLAVRAASREQEMRSKKVVKNISLPPPRPPTLKDETSSTQKRPVTKAKTTVVERSSLSSSTESSSSEGELKTVYGYGNYVLQSKFLAVRQQLKVKE